jgi:hypothetical protein
MTFPQKDSASDNTLPSTSPALLALKRFVRGTFRQVGMGLVSLMVILNLGMHAPERSLATEILATEILATEITPPHLATTQPIHSTQDSITGSSQDAQLVERDLSTSAAHTTHHSVKRRIGRGITYHHLTSARLSISTPPPQSIISVAKAR